MLLQLAPNDEKVLAPNCPPTRLDVTGLDDYYPTNIIDDYYPTNIIATPFIQASAVPLCWCWFALASIPGSAAGVQGLRGIRSHAPHTVTAFVYN